MPQLSILAIVPRRQRRRFAHCTLPTAAVKSAMPSRPSVVAPAWWDRSSLWERASCRSRRSEIGQEDSHPVTLSAQLVVEFSAPIFLGFESLFEIDVADGSFSAFLQFAGLSFIQPYTVSLTDLDWIDGPGGARIPPFWQLVQGSACYQTGQRILRTSRGIEFFVVILSGFVSSSR